MVSFTLRQVTSVVQQTAAPPLYRVINQVTSADGASTSVFVYKAATQAFEHYAAAADMEKWPDSLEEANALNKAFYRLDSVSRTWTSLEEMHEDLDMTLRRVRLLANELTVQRDSIEIDRTTVVEGQGA